MSIQIKGALVPGLPHLIHAGKGTPWEKIKMAYQELGEKVASHSFDSIVICSSQWFSVLGVSFQKKKSLKGIHVDENWYELGDLPFQFESDVELSESFAKDISLAGIPTKLMDYEEFPIDTGTIVALHFLNSKKKIPVSLVSSWVYADADKNRQLGQLMAQTAKNSGKKILFVATTQLSARYFTQEIRPEEDRISSLEDDKWNQTFLGLVELGNLSQVQKHIKDTKTPLDMQLNAFHWLTGVLGNENQQGRVLAYGPIWGTGASVIEFFRGEK